MCGHFILLLGPNNVARRNSHGDLALKYRERMDITVSSGMEHLHFFARASAQRWSTWTEIEMLESNTFSWRQPCVFCIRHNFA